MSEPLTKEGYIKVLRICREINDLSESEREFFNLLAIVFSLEADEIERIIKNFKEELQNASNN